MLVIRQERRKGGELVIDQKFVGDTSTLVKRMSEEPKRPFFMKVDRRNNLRDLPVFGLLESELAGNQKAIVWVSRGDVTEILPKNLVKVFSAQYEPPIDVPIESIKDLGEAFAAKMERPFVIIWPAGEVEYWFWPAAEDVGQNLALSPISPC